MLSKKLISYNYFVKALNFWRKTITEDKILQADLLKKDHFLIKHFTKHLTFGSSGISAPLGAGLDKINIHTIKAIAQAYAFFLLKNNPNIGKKGIIIGHDGRTNGELYAKKIAQVLLKHNIKAFLFQTNKPQIAPVVSYTIKQKKLGGGIFVTAPHRGFQHSGVKFFTDQGGQILPPESIEIENILAKIEPLDVVEAKQKPVEITNKIVNEYCQDIAKNITLQSKNKQEIKVVFSSLNGASMPIVEKLYKKNNILAVEKEASFNFNGKNVKEADPSKIKAYKRAIKLARSKKADIAIIANSNADRIGVAVKYQRRYKYLDNNQLVSLYLNYKLEQLQKNNKLPKDGYIIKTHLASDLPTRIAAKFKINVIDTDLGSKHINKVIAQTKGTFLLAYDENYSLLLDQNISSEYDAMQALFATIEMANFYKKQNLDLFSKLEYIFKEFGIYRTAYNEKELDHDMAHRLFKRLQKNKRILNYKVKKIIDFKKFDSENTAVKVELENGSWFGVIEKKVEQKIKIYTQTKGDRKSSLMQVVIFEREILDFIYDHTEKFENKTWSWRAFFKYLFFVGIVAGIMIFVFMSIYSQSSNGSASIWDDAWSIINRQRRIVWLSIYLFIALNIFLAAWMRKRLIDFQGQKVKTKHLVISGLMGSVISFITPFAIGGDAIGYWYLRRKGFKRSALLSSFITSTIIYQFGIILQSIILIPIGIPLYKEILFSPTAEAKAAFVFFCIGLSWNIFATFMIFSLTIWARFQEFIVRNSVRTLEWLPFIQIKDPGAIQSKYQYEFREMRLGMYKIWQRKRLILEITIYELIPKFLSGGAILAITAGLIKPDLEMGRYLSQIITSDMIGTANSLSLTPGGSGTGEWLSITINQYIFRDDILASGGSDYTASALDFVWKLVSSWPMLIFSTLMIFTIIIGENRVNKYHVINNNRRLRNEKTGRSTRYYRFIIASWIVVICAFLFLFFLIN